MDFGYLVEPIIYGPEKALDFSGIRVKMGDYDKNELGLFMSSKPKIVGDVIAHYRKYCDRVPAVAFCPTVDHAEQVADSFRQAGYRAWSVDGGMDDDHRNRILKGLGNGSVDVVTSCDLIGEGVDIPAIGCAILLRKTQSKGLHIQQIGRALRPFEGKKNAVILDHVGNTMQHGLPDADHVWSLGGEPRKKKGKSDTITVNVTQCMQCYAVHTPAPKCPVCGHQKEQRERVIETEAGELVQITPKSLAQMQKERDQKNARMEVGKSRTLDELKAVAKARGYKDSWAEHVFNSRKNKAQGATIP
jgi:superfamily II DNA or RNA helicase